jgi:hypothetical protein
MIASLRSRQTAFTVLADQCGKHRIAAEQQPPRFHVVVWSHGPAIISLFAGREFVGSLGSVGNDSREAPIVALADDSTLGN